MVSPKLSSVIALVLGLWPMFRTTRTGNELAKG
jgi:hypothetical protein